MGEGKFFLNGPGHITKMASVPIYYGKSILKIFFSRTNRSIALVCSISDLGPS